MWARWGVRQKETYPVVNGEKRFDHKSMELTAIGCLLGQHLALEKAPEIIVQMFFVQSELTEVTNRAVFTWRRCR